MENNSNLVFYKDIKSRKVEWLWYPYIPMGKITIVQGDPGEGKTTFILSLLSILSNGGTLPFSENIVFGKSIYQNMEDDNADTIKPRLELNNANCSNICFINRPNDLLLLDDKEIEKAIQAVQAKVLVLDPIQSFIGENVDMNRANVIRPKLHHLKTVAERTNCAIILIGHLNKNVGSKANYRGLGSIDISAAARSILLIGRSIENPQLRILAQQKNNLGPFGQSLAFSLNDGVVHWLGKYDITADQLIDSSSHTDVPKLINAKVFLVEKLKNGALPYQQIIDAATENGIGKRTLLTAKADLSITSVKIKDRWYWKIGSKKQLEENNEN